MSRPTSTGVVLQGFNNTVGVLEGERRFASEGLWRGEREAAWDETDLAGDEDTFVYLR